MQQIKDIGCNTYKVLKKKAKFRDSYEESLQKSKQPIQELLTDEKKKER